MNAGKGRCRPTDGCRRAFRRQIARVIPQCRNPLTNQPALTHTLTIDDLRPEATPLGRFRCSPPGMVPPRPRLYAGGAGRQFAGGRHFHRGIQAESTWRVILEKENHYQRLAKSRPWRAGFFCGIRGIQFVEATTPEASQRKPACQAPSKQRFDPRRGGIRVSPDRGFSGPLAATPHQLCTPPIARTRAQRRRPRPMAMGGKSECHGWSPKIV